ncbi:glycosyltransferase [Methylocystis sp. FS]|uniref:glycosyltransferase family 2 protein n=1 Tax=Methylocystis silviterrae TaxID=2743612 RepID=UPI001583A338|nr:glycosyltransferase family 2 protein [Methylocystis silviterrae]NUJ81350.1 glycosyltransferase [Methylocystis silviterrae]
MTSANAPGNLSVGVIIPVKNEAAALPTVLTAIPAWATIIVIADANSSDGSREIAAKHGAVVVREPRPGYGRACLTALAATPPVDVIVFLDGDASDDPTEMAALVAPIANGSADFVVGSRTLGECEAGALTPQQLFGNWLACLLMRSIWGARFTDLGPFRAVRRVTLEQLALTDENYGWTVEMQVRAVKHGVRTIEIPVRYRRRIGMSKVSGTIKGVIGAGVKILYIIGREALRRD